MKDTHEANLPTEENGKLEETKAPETTPENTAEEVVTNATRWKHSNRLITKSTGAKWTN
mgnify:CR=1 FL=1